MPTYEGTRQYRYYEHTVPLEVVQELPVTEQDAIRDGIVASLAKAGEHHIPRAAAIAEVLAVQTGLPVSECQELLDPDVLELELSRCDHAKRCREFGDYRANLVRTGQLVALKARVPMATRIVDVLIAAGFFKPSAVKPGDIMAADAVVERMVEATAEVLAAKKAAEAAEAAQQANGTGKTADKPAADEADVPSPVVDESAYKSRAVMFVPAVPVSA